MAIVFKYFFVCLFVETLFVSVSVVNWVSVLLMCVEVSE